MLPKALLIVALLVAAPSTSLIHNDHASMEATTTTHPRWSLDFIQYYTAFKLAVVSENPYDPTLMHREQVALGRSETETIMMWNPPWLLLLLAPVLVLPFPVAIGVWIAVSVFCAIATTLLATTHTSSRTRIYALASIPLFYPFWETLSLGQVSLLLAVSVAVFLWAVQSGRDFLAGVAASVWSIKPHLFLFFGVFLAYQALSHRSYRQILGLGLSLLTLVLCTYLFSPALLTQWIESLVSPPTHPTLVAKVDWRTATLPGLLREWLDQSNGVPPTWPLWVVPLFATVAFALFLLIARPRWNTVAVATPVLGLSLLLSPYGWLYDQSILLTGQSEIVRRAFRSDCGTRHRTLVLVGIVLLFLSAVVFGAQYSSGQDDFIWYPIALIALWAYTHRNVVFRP